MAGFDSNMKLLYLDVGAALFSLSQVMGENTVDINTPFKVASGARKAAVTIKRTFSAIYHSRQTT